MHMHMKRKRKVFSLELGLGASSSPISVVPIFDTSSSHVAKFSDNQASSLHAS